MRISGNYFYGNEVSEYGKKHHRVDYLTLSKAFQSILSNNFMEITETAGIGTWYQESGLSDEDEKEETYQEVFQWYIVDENGAEILKQVNEIVYYNEALDLYLWGVTHCGTAWNYVLTSIEIDSEK